MSLYNVLGITPTASHDDIRNAHKTMLLKHHPDKGGCSDEFKRIKHAYETLIDPIKRAEYDKKVSLARDNTSIDPVLGILKNVVGDLFASHYKKQAHNFQNGTYVSPDIKLKVSIPLKTLFKGENLHVNTQLKTHCELCNGRGLIGDDDVVRDIASWSCIYCQGLGFVDFMPWISENRHTCHTCKQCLGSGNNFKNEHVLKFKCSSCNGSGTVEKTVTIIVPLGFPCDLSKLAAKQHLATIKKAAGYPISKNMHPGDVIVESLGIVDESGHWKVSTDGVLSRHLQISLMQSMMGYPIFLTLPGEDVIPIGLDSIQECIQQFIWYEVQGLPATYPRILLDFSVIIPSTISSSEFLQLQQGLKQFDIKQAQNSKSSLYKIVPILQ